MIGSCKKPLFPIFTWIFNLELYNSESMRNLDLNKGFKEYNWNNLLDSIASKNVIPLIGPELLIVNYKGIKAPLYTHIAKMVASELEVNIINDKPVLSEVINTYMTSKQNRLNTVYGVICDILKSNEFEIPENLKLLAGIDSFNLFITATFDDLLAKALNKVRFDGANQTTILRYRKGTNQDDLNDSVLNGENQTTVVYHLFGQANRAAPFVITEDDLLEFGHLYQNENYRPPNLSKILRNKFILILGCNFQNWLARFLLYAFKMEALLNGSETQGLIADDYLQKDEELVHFLKRCGTQMYYGGDEFIEELSRRWSKYRQETPAIEYKMAQSKTESEVRISVFISYASEDKDFVSCLKEALAREGIDVWFDKEKLESGDFFEKVITHNIQECQRYCRQVFPTGMDPGDQQNSPSPSGVSIYFTRIYR